MRLDQGGQGNIIDYSPKLHTIGKELLPKGGEKIKWCYQKMRSGMSGKQKLQMSPKAEVTKCIYWDKDTILFKKNFTKA